MDGTITIGTELETSMFDKQLRLLEDKLEGLVEEYKILENANPFEGQNRELLKLNKEINTTRKEIAKLKSEQKSFDLSQIGKGMEKITKKVGRWALGVFGVYSAYSFVRNAINTITRDDEQLAQDIQLMKNALAYTIEPLVRKIVELAKTLMNYIAYIVRAWTGRDIFASASKNLKNASKSAKELQKTSASFDKFNKLSASKGGGGGGATPSIKSIDGNVPEWIKWIAENSDIVKAGLIAIASGLVAVKLGLTAIQGLGLGIALYGIMTTILNIIKFLKNPTFNNFLGILKGIAIAVTGIGILFVNLPVIIGGAIALIITFLLKYYDKVIDIFNGILKWLEGPFVDKLHYLFGPIGDIIAMPFILAVTLIKSAFESLFGGIKKIINGIVQIFKGDFKNGIKTAFSGLKDILLAPFKALIDLINATIKGINRLTGSKIPLISLGNTKQASMGGRAKGGIYYPKLAMGGIINQPGRGVPYHGATIGERGAEAVVPLTDTAQMELLGESIGRHIKFNADITLELESRVLARVMKEINSEDKFARNGG